MFKQIVLFFALMAVAFAAPNPKPGVVAPVVAAPVAYSAGYVAPHAYSAHYTAPVAAAYASPYAYSPYAYSAYSAYPYYY